VIDLRHVLCVTFFLGASALACRLSARR
jgi:hypothetical protein